MRRFRRMLAGALAGALALSTALPAFANEANAGTDGGDSTAGMISIASDWSGSVFGSVGGQDKITSENFGITENGDGTVTLRSANDRGKISSSEEGIAYYYKSVPVDADFELKATARVDAWTANNQVAFGLMLRSKVYQNVSSVTDVVYSDGSYLAVGALDQSIKSFRKLNAVEKTTFASAAAPAGGATYELSIKKSGNSYMLRVGDETQTIENLPDALTHAGLFTSRNVTVTYSQISLQIVPKIDLGDWTFEAFGTSVNTTDVPPKNPDPILGGDGSVTLQATRDGGKIASGDIGVSYYYKTIPAGVDFELYAEADVNAFNGNSQSAFGLMAHDEVGQRKASYAAVGGIGLAMKPFQMIGSKLERTPFAGLAAPAPGGTYALKLKKSGDAYAFTVNGQTETAVLPGLFTGETFAGLFVARVADVTFRSFDVKADGRVPTALAVDASGMKTSYLVGEALNLSGLQVTATYAGGATETLSPLDYIVTGYDSSVEGTPTVTVHFNGATATFPVEVIALAVTDLSVKYYPAKSTYYVGDAFDPAGMTVVASYNNGSSGELGADLYTIGVSEATVTGDTYVFESPGAKTVTVTSVETPAKSTSFDVEVKAAALTGLEIRQAPQKTLYYLGDVLDLDGLVVYAKYDDGFAARLTKQEYTVSALDTSTAGERSVRIAHKGATIDLPLTVKAKELTGLRVTSYPKTTYAVGEVFDPAGIVVSKAFDNGDLEPLAPTAYTVDAAAMDAATPGIYEVKIIPSDDSVMSITLPVTVRAAATPEWKSIRFGQSTSDSKNTVTVKNGGVVELVALEGAGKITGDHDGISFYYTELDAAADNFVLSANIKVVEYAKNPHDGQESFGLMARDAIGEARTSSVFASNIAAVGGYSGGSRDANGTQLFVRTGVASSDGSGSMGVRKMMLREGKPTLANTYPAQAYRLTLTKTNTGFMGKINDGPEQLFYEPDILKVQNGKMYVGFYAARLATIEVSNINLTVTASATDAPKVEAPLEPVTPELAVVSLDRTPLADYMLRLQSNVNGTATVKQGQTVIAADTPIVAGEIAIVPATLVVSGDTNFSVSFLPDDTQVLTSYDRLVKNFTVTRGSYEGDIFVAPNGTASGSGTKGAPLDLDTAIHFVKPGQKILMLDGRYVRSEKLEIKKYNDGTANARKTLEAAPGARPIVDFDKKTEGVVLSGHYWHVKGIDFTRSAGNMKGFTVGGSHNIVEQCRFYENGDTGLQISRTDSAETMDAWPSHNLILNSTSFDNRDPSDNNADGFAAKLTSGVGNVFRGTIAHNNIDDGWDLYTKAGSGPIGAVLIEDSIAYGNGALTDGTVGAGDKNGFKLGGEGIHVPHIIRRSLAFGNGAYGFTSNSNPGVIAENNIGFDNARGNLSFTTYPAITPDFKINGFVSYQKSHAAKDSYPSALASNANYFFDGMKSVNAAGVALTEANFVTLTAPASYERAADGSIVWGDFLRFMAPRGDGEDSGNGSGSASGVTPAAVTTVGADGSVTIAVKPSVNANGVARVAVEAEAWKAAVGKASTNAAGKKVVVVEAMEAANVKSFDVSVPAEAFGDASADTRIVVRTSTATVTLPGGMLSGSVPAGASTVGLMIVVTAPAAGGAGDLVVDLTLAVDGEPIAWSHTTEAVTVALPFTPGETMTDEEFIVVRHVKDDGTTEPVTNAKYDAAAGEVRFSTRHFSRFAVTYERKTFVDVESIAWAKHAIDVLASKGVIRGVSHDAFAPGAEVTRADFALLLVRALDLAADVEAGSAFSDVPHDAYYADAVAVAHALGLVNGRTDGSFDPGASISRQEMFVIAARALRAAGLLEDASAAEADRFADVEAIASYAIVDLAALAAAGLAKGDEASNVRPNASTSRAEAAVFLYRLYNLE
ncbi:bacterial Ig-like domain-containing protein [Paenibacillus sp. TRM 82003]|nr:bacterial Ig-like domain-containing protein [Paenibacillus sp. TRM 82003]